MERENFMCVPCVHMNVDTHSKCYLALAQQHDYDHKCFEHSCCYCNSQKNLLNAFLHDVRESTYQCVCLCLYHEYYGRQYKIGDHGVLFSISLVYLACLPACLSVSYFLLPYLQIRTCNLQTNKNPHSLSAQRAHTITMFGPVSSCTTLLLVIGRREIRFYTENDHVFSLLNYLLFDICFFFSRLCFFLVFDCCCIFFLLRKNTKYGATCEH